MAPQPGLGRVADVDTEASLDADPRLEEGCSADCLQFRRDSYIAVETCGCVEGLVG